MFSTKISKQLILTILLLNFTALFAQRAELVERRTLYSKTYRNPDNTLTMAISAGPVHFRDGNDKFQEIDNTIKSSRTEYDYEVSQGFYHAYFKKDLLSEFPVAFETKDGASLKTKLVAMAYLDANSKDYKIIQNVQPSAPIISRNEVYYPNVFDGIDLKYIYQDYRLKEEILVTQAARDNLPDPKKLGMNKNNTSLVFITQLGLEGAPNIFAKNEKVKSKVFEGFENINFRNLKGDIKFFLPLDWAYRQADLDSLAENDMQKISKRLIHTENGHFLLCGIKLKDLTAMGAGTVIFDPQIVLGDDAGESFDNSLNFKNGTASNADKNWGGEDKLRVQRSNFGSYHKWRTLIRFDLSTINANSVITAANLKLNYEFIWTSNAYPIDIDVHTVTTAWDEGNEVNVNGFSCWNKPVSGAPDWAGGTFASPEIATVNFISAPTVATWEAWDITSTVQDWVDATIANNGILVKYREDHLSKNAYFRYHSSESSVTASRPVLEVTYDEAAAPYKTTYYVRDASGQVIATYED